MKKRLTALLLCVALAAGMIPAAGAAFTDISDPDTALAAAALEGLGIVSGTGSGSFDPNSTLTRAQVCVLAVNAMGLSGQVNTYARKTLFSDAAPSAWYNGYVNLAYTKGIVNGYGDGTFGPNDPITYGQLATILLRMLSYTSAEIGSLWPLDYTSFCDELGLSEGLTLSPMKAVTRGQTAVLLYRALKETVSGSDRSYYETISGVSSTSQAILLDVSASYGGSSGLLMAYTLGQSGGMEYYVQAKAQSATLTGSAGVLLFNGGGKVVGFIPDEGGSLDLTVGSATASTLTSSVGTSYRISSGALVLSGGESYAYSTSGYLQLNAAAGKTVRLYYDDSGAVSYLYLTGGTAASSGAAVASTTSAASSLARALGISSQSYTITKNGAAATSADLAQYDVGYYDGASATLRASDWRVSGYLTAASPSVTAAQTVTVAGHSFDVLECAWDSLSSFALGDKVTLLLTDDCKVAAVYATSALSADMVGLLATDGKSVTLTGSGVALSADTMNYESTALGALVTVSATSSSTLYCRAVSAVSGQSLSVTARTLGTYSLAPSCAIYEWAGSGYVYDLEGNQGSSSSSLSGIDWTEKLSASSVSYYRLNSAGQVDAVLLRDVTGNLYDYGKLTVYSGESGINLGGSGTMSAYNTAAALTNGEGATTKYLCSLSASGGSFVGVALGQSSHGYGQVVKLQTLTRLSDVSGGAFFQQSGEWYAQVNGTEYPISQQVQLYVDSTGRWLSGWDGLTSALADGGTLTLYYDRAPSSGGQIRVITVE